jgi:hypothetical protein
MTYIVSRKLREGLLFLFEDNCNEFLALLNELDALLNEFAILFDALLKEFNIYADEVFKDGIGTVPDVKNENMPMIINIMTAKIIIAGA